MPPRKKSTTRKTALPGAAPAAAPPAAAASDATLERLVDQVRAAPARGALCIRGAGTKDFYGGVPVGEPLDTTGLRGITSYEHTEMVVTARAGTPLAELESALAERGQWLAFEPPRFAVGGTVGGMVAAGLAGPSRAAAGAVRDYVLGAVLLNGRAEVLRFGGQVMKNVAGYDVARALAGSMGVLGVICEVSLKVLPLPPARATLRFEIEQAAAIERLHRWIAAGLPVTASAWRGETLHVRLAGARAAVQAAATRLAAEADGRVLDPAAADALWLGLRDHRDEFFARAIAALAASDAPRELRLWRLSVPSHSAPFALAGDILVEWGGAQRWFIGSAPVEQVRALAANAGGHAAIFRGRTRDAGFLPALSPKLMSFHKKLKQAFDPENIFNRGRLLDEL